ncbi:MAG: M20/M25/M40 family metallo-hydrolase [Thermoleophilia bacterium]
MNCWGLSAREYADVEAEVVGLLSRLIQADTSNPPGDVTSAARVLEEYYAANGMPVTTVGEVDERPNCVARLGGAGGAPTLLLLGHIDVVPAVDADEWTEPPFSGVVKDGYVWGRGALDMKNMVAAEAVALVRLARAAATGDRLRGDLIVASTADEESGDFCGAKWLTEQHPDLVRCDYVLNEGGFEMLHVGDRRLYTIHAGEKGYANSRIVVHGHGGHGSMPQHERSVAHAVARVVKAIEEYDPEVLTTRTPVELIDYHVRDADLRRRLMDPATARDAVRELAVTNPDVARLIEPQLGLTFATTNITVGHGAVNVIPGRGEIIVDCRVLPGQTPDDVRREFEAALKGVAADWEFDCFCFTGANQSPPTSALRDAIGATMAELVPDGDVICENSAGFTDCTHFRAAFPDTVCYGFTPFVEETAAAITPRFHGRDERISVADLVFQTIFIERTARQLLT